MNSDERKALIKTLETYNVSRNTQKEAAAELQRLSEGLEKLSGGDALTQAHGDATVGTWLADELKTRVDFARNLLDGKDAKS